MKENKYDNINFFTEYSKMSRSVNGLDGAGEWHILQKMLPDFKNKRVLDLGCGFGWHCQYAIAQGASAVIGIDISEKMLAEAQKKNTSANVQYLQMPIEDIDFPIASFDIVISSLAFHYVESFSTICKKVNHCLSKGGSFVFSVEHPVFTAQGKQDWHYDEEGKPLHWPVDRYFESGLRTANFLGEAVTKYHKTLTTYINDLIQSGFEITVLSEPEPEERLLKTVPGMDQELRRPIFLIIAAIKK